MKKIFIALISFFIIVIQSSYGQDNDKTNSPSDTTKSKKIDTSTTLSDNLNEAPSTPGDQVNPKEQDETQNTKIKLDIISPSQNTIYKNANYLDILWNYTEDSLNKDKINSEVKIFYSTNNGEDFTKLITDTIKLSDKRYRWQIPNNISSDYMVMKIEPIDSDIEFENNKSKKFKIEGFVNTNANFFFRAGTNFNYAAKTKVSGLYLGINARFPKLVEILKNKYFGIQAYFSQGLVEYNDSIFNSKSGLDSNVYNKNIRSESGENKYTTASIAILWSLNNNISIIFPHLELNYNNVLQTSNIIINSSTRRQIIDSGLVRDTIIRTKDTTINYLSKIEQLFTILGIGTSITISKFDFDFSIDLIAGLNLGNSENNKGFLLQQYIGIVRFNLRNIKSGVNLGGEIAGPYNSIDGNSRTGYNLRIYGAFDIDLGGIIKTGN